MDGLAAEYRGDMYVRNIDIDNPANRALVDFYGARSIPLIVMLNDQGQIIATFQGVTQAQRLRESIHRALASSTGSPLRSG